MLDFVEFSDSHELPEYNIWLFICMILLLILNLYGKSIKSSITEEYQIRSVVSALF